MLRSETRWIVPRQNDVEEGRRGNGVKETRNNVRTVLVYADRDRREDARYVTAALRAAAEATAQPVVFTPGMNADWIVWLAAGAIPDSVLERTRRGAVLLTDAASDEPQNAAGRVRLTAASDPEADAPLLRRRTAAGDDAPVWTDDAGRPVLTVRREGAGLWLKFHARFHPTWGDLVLHPAFPEAMTALWAGDKARALARADQPIALGQLLPARDASGRSLAAPQRVDLYHAFWLVGVLLFLLERVLAARARTVES
jgi:hypothetical protein